MLCSVPPGKSGPNWLDRLRSNKGFPTTDDDNNSIDHFLHSQKPSESTRSSSESTQSQHEQVANETHQSGGRQQHQQQKIFNLIGNVLSELFFMDGDTDDHHEAPELSGKKKFPRKQTTPKFLTTSTNNSSNAKDEEKSQGSVPKDENAPSTASFHSDNSLKEGNVEEEEEEEQEEEKEKGERELVGYSRSEVTVIDTSFGVWKNEKVVYRRRNVWKVREKRGKVRSFGKKKRKESGGCDHVDENVGGVLKKAKLSGSESAAPSNEGQNPQNDRREEVCKETPDDLSQVPKKRFPFSRSPRKSRKGVSSVILIKGISTSNKNGAKVPGKCPKDTQ